MNENVLPHRKSPGALIAFSGLDGTVDFDNQLVGSVMDEDYGFGIHITQPKDMMLWCDTRTAFPFKVIRRLVLSDALSYIVKKPNTSSSAKILFVLIDDRTVLGRTTTDFPVFCCNANASEAATVSKNKIDLSNENTFAVLLTKTSDREIIFAFSASLVSQTDAESRARKVLKFDVDAEFDRKKKFFATLPAPNTENGLLPETYYKAMSVLKSMVYSPAGKAQTRWTTPDRMPHRRMWLWDSAFHALGLQYISPRLAQEAIEAVFAYQENDGFIPHMMSPGYRSTNIQPPVLGWGAMEIYKRNPSDEMREFLGRIAAPLEQFIRWVLQHRAKRKGTSLGWSIRKEYSFPLCRSGETGMDNSPRFDNAEDVESVDIIAFTIQEIEMLRTMSEILGQIPATDLIQKRQELIHVLQTRFWDAKDGFFYDRRHDGDCIRVKTVSAFTPLFAGAAMEEQAASMIEHLRNPKEFWAHFPVPSTALSEPAYTKDYWRGPTWINYNYLVIQGLRRYGYHRLAEKLRRITLDEITRWYQKEGVFFELYDAESKLSPEHLKSRSRSLQSRPRCLVTGAIKDYGWTAALYMHLTLERTT